MIYVLLVTCVLVVLAVVFNLLGNKVSARIFTPFAFLFLLFDVFWLLWQNKLIFVLFVLYIVGCYVVGHRKYGEFNYSYVDVFSSKVSGDYKCVYLSDFQLDKSRTSLNIKVLEDIVGRTNLIKKDILLLGGDYVNYNCHIDSFFDVLSSLEIPRLGGFVVLGNHDYIAYDEIVGKFEGLGFVVVEDRKFVVNPEFVVVGVSDEWYGDPKLVELYADEFNLCLAHNPDFVKRLADVNDVDVVLSGHYHGGQFNMFGVALNRVVSKYISGVFELKGLKLIVSNGLGGTMLRGRLGAYVRLYAQPEFVILNVKRKR